MSVSTLHLHCVLIAGLPTLFIPLIYIILITKPKEKNPNINPKISKTTQNTVVLPFSETYNFKFCPSVLSTNLPIQDYVTHFQRKHESDSSALIKFPRGKF